MTLIIELDALLEEINEQTTVGVLRLQIVSNGFRSFRKTKLIPVWCLIDAFR